MFINKNKVVIFDQKSLFDNYIFLILNIHRFIEFFFFIFAISIYFKTCFFIKFIIMRLIFNFLKKYKSTILLYFAILTSFLMYSHTLLLFDNDHHSDNNTNEKSFEDKAFLKKLILIFLLGFTYGGFILLVCNKLENSMLSKAMTELKIPAAKKEYLLNVNDCLRPIVFSGVFTAGVFCCWLCVTGAIAIHKHLSGS